MNENRHRPYAQYAHDQLQQLAARFPVGSDKFDYYANRWRPSRVQAHYRREWDAVVNQMKQLQAA